MQVSLKWNIFKGGLAENRFAGGLNVGVYYDYINAINRFEHFDGSFSTLHPCYELGGLSFVPHLRRLGLEGRVLDLGTGTGAALLPVVQAFPNLQFVGMDVSEGMLGVAQYKYYQRPAQVFEKTISTYFKGGNVPQVLRSYWDEFRKKSEPLKGRVQFLQGNIEAVDTVVDGLFDGAVANQVLHNGVDIPKFLLALRGSLRKSSSLLWSSMDRFFDDPEYPTLEYSSRCNTFLGMVAEEVRTKGYTVAAFWEAAKPKYNLPGIQRMTETSGFTTELVGRRLLNIDFQRYVSFDVPMIIAGLIQDPLTDEVKEKAIGEATLRVISQSGFGSDIQSCVA